VVKFVLFVVGIEHLLSFQSHIYNGRESHFSHMKSFEVSNFRRVQHILIWVC